jgi:putative acyl-CoA dehydrogenase
VTTPAPHDTHKVTNQPPPLEGYDAFGADVALVEAVRREAAGWAEDALHDLGVLAGSAEAIGWGFDANANPPVLRTHDRYGHRLDRVDYHPSYHRLTAVAVEHGLHGAPWADPRPGAHVARAAGSLLWGQVDAGHGCPISMTYSVVPALGAAPDLLAEWMPLLTSRSYDPSFAPASAKAGALAGMGMTEKQGGSDVRAGSTRAEPVGDGWRLTGHKWFCSAPMCDVFLMLAQAPGGLSCFLVPRFTPDGSPNPFRLQRLKDKLGNRSNASSEVELDGTWARMVGEEGRGVATIIEMVNHTRLDCVVGAASGIRQAVAQACHHARHRSAFGRDLVDQPLMTAVLADLAVESEAATAVAMRLARAYDEGAGEAGLRRLATAVAKYWVCKRHPVAVVEALECLGGNGYVEESIMPRLFRESPLNGIWEGSGNVICLDVLRAMARNPESVEAYMAELATAAGGDHRLDAAIAAVGSDLAALAGRTPEDAQAGARRLVERLALALQGALLVRDGHPAVADAFCASRLGDGGRAFGTMPAAGALGALDHRAIVERATPKL